MTYRPILTEGEANGLFRNKKEALEILRSCKLYAHNIRVGNLRRVALCNISNEIIHIVTKKSYQEYISPKLEF